MKRKELHSASIAATIALRCGLGSTACTQVFRRADAAREACKREEAPEPAWVSALYRPAAWAAAAADKCSAAAEVSLMINGPELIRRPELDVY